MSMLHKVEVVVRPFFLAESKLLVGVSGGPDSLALLHVLKVCCGPERLVVAHVNHGLRPTADLEAAFVQETAASWRIPCYVEKLEVAAVAQEEKLTLEEAGRVARYRFFAALCHQLGIQMVAVGHHAGDQAETVLMHLLRGSGLAGLRGMLPVSLLPEAGDVMLLRPLLAVHRAEIEVYCLEQGLLPVQDDSNQDITFFRNRLRHELIPFLQRYNPKIVTQLAQLAEITTADDALLEQLTEETWAEVLVSKGVGWVCLHKGLWHTLPVGLQRRVLRRAVNELRPFLRDVAFLPVEQARLIAILGETGAQSVLSGQLTLTVTYEQLIVAEETAVLPVTLPQLLSPRPEKLPLPGKFYLANGWVIESRLFSVNEAIYPEVTNDPWQVTISLPVDEPLYVRARLPGERFQPSGMGGHSAKVQDVMVNRKISAVLRAGWPIVATDSHLVWLVGHQIDERVKVTAENKPMIRLHCYQTVGETD